MSDILRLVDSICRDKNIDKDQLYANLDLAMVAAIRKQYGEDDEAEVTIDRVSGGIKATHNGAPIALADLGRISAQSCKQVMIQKIREAERESVFDEYSQRVGTIVTGTVSRYESGALVINLGRTEGYLPRSEQIPGETHHPGDRIRAMILDVRETPHQVRILVSRSHPDYIRRLFELEVPEVGERIIEIRVLAREAGYRTKVAVASIDSKVDAVGACVGVRGSRIRNIVDELGGEKIDIVRWNESSQVLIANALKPAEVQETALCFELGRAIVVVVEDQLSLAIGKRGQNVRLAARLTDWDIDILTPAEYNKNLDDMEKTFKKLGIEDVIIDKLMALGMVSLMDVEEVGTEPLVNELGITQEQAELMVQTAGTEARRLAAEAVQAKKEADEAAQAEKDAADAAAKQQSEADGEADPQSPGEDETSETDPQAVDGSTEAPSQTAETEETELPVATGDAPDGSPDLDTVTATEAESEIASEATEESVETGEVDDTPSETSAARPGE